ncbi:MAG: hypothetical protein A2W72_06835 [Burkholderiales bacterium RIFCSPLOWO2_12_67_14]|nr:MAG: hypothetical protein A3I64_12895 [Burkholderiales bacterium RIFCSPLOWO2_02_FULL_67_64]OGB39226.1 MAG: hypothetical protein A3E51_19930 [Burkholderiales bacterium RIFCSPHIGHO2_12_FULL_67_38]OGB41731.1 MAG: hypothetical protein A2W72_06835 [Burkholderiales bacterium RIFCSPLOWO2_12_67_14]
MLSLDAELPFDKQRSKLLYEREIGTKSPCITVVIRIDGGRVRMSHSTPSLSIEVRANSALSSRSQLVESTLSA